MSFPFFFIPKGIYGDILIARSLMTAVGFDFLDNVEGKIKALARIAVEILLSHRRGFLLCWNDRRDKRLQRIAGIAPQKIISCSGTTPDSIRPLLK